MRDSTRKKVGSVVRVAADYGRKNIKTTRGGKKV